MEDIEKGKAVWRANGFGAEISGATIQSHIAIRPHFKHYTYSTTEEAAQVADFERMILRVPELGNRTLVTDEG